MESFFAHDIENGWDSDTGKPSLAVVGAAIQFYTIQNNVNSVAVVADVFKMKHDDVVTAVNAHPWMYVQGSGSDDDPLTIEHDGE